MSEPPEVALALNTGGTQTTDLMSGRLDFDTDPSRYRHWSLDVEAPVATLRLAVDPDGGLRDDYQLKTNSYDLSVDIELHDAVQRLRFEHPEVGAVVVTGGLDKIFCAGANIQMLANSSHIHKVNFCKFTNETRNSIEDATENSGQSYIAAVNGTAAGGGYELALACDEIVLVDDKASSVSLPEVPLLAVLPGTGGLTRIVEKRHVRRDLADAFSTRAEGVRGTTALEWRLVDHIAPPSTFDEVVASLVAQRAAESERPSGPGIDLTPLNKSVLDNAVTYSTVQVSIDRSVGAATITIASPTEQQPSTGEELAAIGEEAWIIRAARELDDAVLDLRFNEPEIGTWVFKTTGNHADVRAAEEVIETDTDHWLARETRLLWARTFERVDVSARSLIAIVGPGSCFTGTLAELVLASDRSFMLTGTWEEDDVPPPPAVLRLTPANLGSYPMANGLTRLATRFWGRDDVLRAAEALVGFDLDAGAAIAAELVTFGPDDLDWDDELRIALEERNSFSPDALTGMEANYRFVGPETMKTKIFARLSAWQNWIFQRPNAVGPEGALTRFGTGSRPAYDRRRV